MPEDRGKKERKFWSRFASRYDGFVDRRVKSYDSLIAKIVDEIKDDWVVLEVAAGTGLIALPTARRAKTVYAVDITPRMIARAEEKAAAQGITNIVFSVQDAYALPFSDATFDAAVCSNALHNMQDPGRALFEMRRVLKPAGRLIAPTICHGHSLKTRVISRLIRLTGFPSFQRFTEESFVRLVEDSGFVIERCEVIPEVMPIAFVTARPR